MKLSKIVEVLKNRPKVKTRGASILEIGGFPHYENVISNFLAFYLNPNRSHGLGDLFIKSLFELLGNNNKTISTDLLEVRREVKTQDHKRIDILVISESEVIAFEVKVFHVLNNPLKSYCQYLREKYGEKKKTKIILSLLAENDTSGFKAITFEDYGKVIEKNLGKYLNSANVYHTTFVTELFDTLKKLKYGAMDEQEINYIKENFEDFSDTYKLFSRYFTTIEKKLDDVQKVLRIGDYTKSIDRWKGPNLRKRLQNVLVYHLVAIEGAEELQLKIRLSAKGWLVQVWNTEKLPNKIRKKILENMNFLKSGKGEEYIQLNEKKFSASHKAIKDDVYEIISIIYEK